MVFAKIKITRRNIIVFFILLWFCAAICMVKFLEEYQESQSMHGRTFGPNSTNKYRWLLKDHDNYDYSSVKDAGCVMPKLDPFSREIMRFVKDGTKIKCPGKDWVKCYFSKCRVVPDIVRSIKNSSNELECTYRDILFVSDNTYAFGFPLVLKGDREYILSRSDHVEIKCILKNSNSTNSTWFGHGVGFAQTEPKEVVNKSINVLIFAIDSASKNGFIRKMPFSYSYLKEELGAVILNGYNIVGDGTPAALFPILTGKTEPELPYCGKDSPRYLDDTKPFIYHKLRKAGYRTAYFEDAPSIGTFQYRFNGFRHCLADHYVRAFYLAVRRLWLKNGSKKQYKYCVGDTPSYKLMMNITDQFFHLNGNKFIFTFVSDISHNNFNVVRVADRPFVSFLQGFLNKGWLKDTLLVVMGDHGPRYDSLRNTNQGRLEERLPFMAIRLPDDLKLYRPEAEMNLKKNIDTLTSPHDIYATLLDVLDMREHWNEFKTYGSDLKRGMTLLEPIPKTRSCADAGISPYWCACSQWSVMKTYYPLRTRVAQALVVHINYLTEIARSKCLLRTLTSVEWVMKMRRNNTNKDEDIIQRYQVKLSVGPGQGDFEGAVVYNRKYNKFHVNSLEISRTNGYNSEPDCITALYPRLNPYCYCQPLKPNNSTNLTISSIPDN